MSFKFDTWKKSITVIYITFSSRWAYYSSSIHDYFRKGGFQFLSEIEMGSRFLTLCGFTVGQLVHLFFLTVMGQFVVNSNEEIFQRMYDR
ncbi:hypothetical protein E2986_13459 [Frieseomelitta varia]|uniref:Uncharacterized protein n=1 Tax=Frieseomelitta varia TaxID=561572 RepID=A0A833W7T0_9HYME|nr:hypothetical protein E2986_13459 [Frieseomelitta varia]